MTGMPWTQTQDCNGCMQTPPLLCLSGWVWLILLATADSLVRPWIQKLALALRGLGQQLLWSHSSMTVLFWSKSNQAAHNVLWAVYQLCPQDGSGEVDGRMGTSQSSVLPWRRQDLGPQATAERHQLRSLTSELYQPEKGRGYWVVLSGHVRHNMGTLVGRHDPLR